jgi:hypothetical protein
MNVRWIVELSEVERQRRARSHGIGNARKAGGFYPSAAGQSGSLSWRLRPLSSVSTSRPHEGPGLPAPRRAGGAQVRPHGAG